MNKIVRDGMVAVLYSPGWGAGWYTWNTDVPECLFDPDIARIVLGEKTGSIADIAEEKWGTNSKKGYFYAGGWEDLRVAWLPEGTLFRIDEYDGNESVVTQENLYLVA